MRKILVAAILILLASSAFASTETVLTNEQIEAMLSNKKAVVGAVVVYQMPLKPGSKIITETEKALHEKFPDGKYVLKIEDWRGQAVRDYCDKHGMPYPYMLNGEAAANMAEENGWDYAVLLKVGMGGSTGEAFVVGATFKSSCELDVRAFRMPQKEQVFSRLFTSEGTSSGALIVVPSFERAYFSALQKALLQFKEAFSL